MEGMDQQKGRDIIGFPNEVFVFPPPPIQQKPNNQPPFTKIKNGGSFQLPKIGQVLKGINEQEPYESFGSESVFNSYTSMCNPFTYHMRYPGSIVPGQQPIYSEQFMEDTLLLVDPINQSKQAAKRRRKSNGGRTAPPRRRKICEKFLRLPYNPKGKLNIFVNKKQHIELRDTVNNLKFKYIKYRNITSGTGELIFKEHCCSERKKQKCNARIIERLKDGFCCLQGSHICGGSQENNNSGGIKIQNNQTIPPPPMPPPTVTDVRHNKPNFPSFSRNMENRGIPQQQQQVNNNNNNNNEVILPPIRPPSFDLPPPPMMSDPALDQPNHDMDWPFKITGVLPTASCPRTTIHIFLKCLPHIPTPQNLKITFGKNTVVQNSSERIMIPCVIPSTKSAWRGDFQSDFCVYCVVPLIPNLKEATLIDIEVELRSQRGTSKHFLMKNALEYIVYNSRKKRKRRFSGE